MRQDVCCVPAGSGQMADGIQDMSGSVLIHHIRCFLILCTCSGVWGGLSSAQGQESKAVWGLRARDVFSMNLMSQRATSLTFGGNAPILIESRDFLRLEYRVESVGANGDAIMTVRFFQPQRESSGDLSRDSRMASGALSRLANCSVRFRVDPFGVASAIDSAGHNGFLLALAGTDESYTEFLQAACPDDVYSSWLGRPFWFPRRDMISKNQKEWTANITDSVGAFGLLRTALTLKPEVVDGETLVVAISGKPEFAPLVLPTKAVAPESVLQLPIREITIQSGSVTGKAQQRRRPPATNLVAPARQPARPPFDLIEVTISVTGKGQVDESFARSLPAKEFQFEHSSRSSMMITGYAFSENLLQELPLAPLEENPQ